MYKAWIIIEDIDNEGDWDGEFSLTGQEHQTIDGVLDEIWRILWTTDSPAMCIFDQGSRAVREWAETKEKTGNPVSPQSTESEAPQQG